MAEEQHALEQTADELQLLRALTADPQIAHGLANPLLSPSARRGLALAIADQFKSAPMMRNFLALLADHRRLDRPAASPSSTRSSSIQSSAACARRSRRPHRSAPSRRDSVIARAGRLRRGARCSPSSRSTRSLLGGVVVDIEGKVYDGSLRTQLEGLAPSIAGGRSLL